LAGQARSCRQGVRKITRYRYTSQLDQGQNVSDDRTYYMRRYRNGGLGGSATTRLAPDCNQIHDVIQIQIAAETQESGSFQRVVYARLIVSNLKDDVRDHV
jgi:hypothetical protein